MGRSYSEAAIGQLQGDMGIILDRANLYPKVLELREQGLTFKEIGQRLGIKPGTAWTLAREARNARGDER